MKFLQILLISFMPAMMTGCFPANSDSQTAEGGSGSEVTGTAKYPDEQSPKAPSLSKLGAAAGLPVIAAKVFMYPKSFVPDSSMVSSGGTPKTYTGDDGTFRITNVPIGVYMLEVNDGAGKAKSHTVSVPDDSIVVDVGEIIIEPTGSIQLHVNVSLPGEILYYISLEGTRCIIKGNQSDIDVTLEGIPSGASYTLNARMVKPVPGEIRVENVSVSPGLLTILEPINF